ncbi:hypothetical protein BOX15_Mlig030377g2 [Macrostomum lignano]|uniref:C2H2-type domain-containing protein n=1 Tax=Macrostomum lignano TaxID=282301 RepID=A0A267FGI5_9PLAT|nr:hypothetical protein BOX15_Mlig030377g2 [Macrostomum lignano]
MTSSNSASAFASIDLDSLLDEGGSASFQSALRQSDLLFGDIEHSEMALDLRTAARKKSEQVSGVFRSQKRCPQPTRRSRRLRDSIEQLSLSLANEVGQSALCLLVTLRCRLAGQHCLSIPISSLCRVASSGCQLDIHLQEHQPPRDSALAATPIACIECDLKFDRADAAVSHFQRLTSSGGRHQRYRVLLLCGQAGCGKLFTNYTSRIAHRSRVHGIVCHDRVAVAKCVIGPDSRLYQLIGRQLVDCGAYRDNGELPGPAVV